MIRPVQITFRNMESAEAVEAKIHAEAKIRAEAIDLDSFYDRIVGCRVVVEVPHRRHERGNVYHVRIDITVPGDELVVRHEPGLHGATERSGIGDGTKAFEAHAPHKSLTLAIHDAFDLARRQVQDYARRQQGEVKVHEVTPHARVVRIFPEEDYGFLETPEGNEVYFHRNSVLNAGFERLKVGMEVTFVEEEGEKGVQASTVKLVP